MKKLNYSVAFALGWLFASATAIPGCSQDAKSSNQAAVANEPASSSHNTESKVSKIVFIGKQEACECTRKRIDDSWNALTKALDKIEDITVERIQMDTEQAKAAAYQQQRSIMVIPAVFFLDASGKLVDVLQGEISTEQFFNLLR